MSSYALPATSGPRRAPRWSANRLRQLSRDSLDRPSELLPPPQSPPDTVSSNSTIRERPMSASRRSLRTQSRCSVTVNNEAFAQDEVLLNLDLVGGEDIKPGHLVSIDVLKVEADRSPQIAYQRQQLQEAGSDSSPAPSVKANKTRDSEKRYVFIAKDMPKELKAKYPSIEVYVAKNIADAFGMKKGSQVILAPIDANNPATEASHVELSFKDQYLSRSDMWRMAVGELSERTVFKGQTVLFMGTIKVQVTTVFVEGKKVQSAFFGANTKPIFRSESARYVLFIQMAREMWDFDSEGTGEILFNKVVNGFLPALFKKWRLLKAKHLVSIVLFARVEYDTGISTELASAAVHNDYYTGVQTTGEKRPYKDFYRVVVSEMGSGEWARILYQLKREFNFFRRDISTYHETAMSFPPPAEDAPEKDFPANRIKAQASRAMYGNVLEAINMASTLFAHDYIDRDLTRTGISVVVVTPSPGVFEVEYEALRRTTEALVGNGIGIDLICIPKIPLHSVPLFRYRNPNHVAEHASSRPAFVLSRSSTPKQTTSAFGSFTSMSSSISPGRGADTILRSASTEPNPPSDEWAFALPQWLHVAYWTGDSREALSYQGIALSVSDTLQKQKQASEEFTIRCRMYELQMHSVMETNEIETLPLYSDPFFPRRATRVTHVPKPNSQLQTNLALFDHVHGFKKFDPEKEDRAGEISLWKQLREYDEARSRVSASRRAAAAAAVAAAAPRHVRDHEDTTTRRQLLEDTNLFGTSFTERRTSLSIVATATPPVSALTRRVADKTEASQTQRPRRDSRLADLPSKTASLSKPPKVMRQLSLGNRGFGVAAPKAVVAEVSAETVSASTTTPGRSPQVMMPTMSSRRPASPLTIPRGSYAPPTSDPMATPTRPMSIRGAQPSLEAAQNTPGSILASTLRPGTGHELDIGDGYLVDNYYLKRHHDDGFLADDVKKIKAEDAQRMYNSKLLAGALPELPRTLSHAVSPWLTLVNPSNPASNQVDVTTLYSRWQHVFPKPSDMIVQNWKALVSPASVPLTTEWFPTKAQFESDYQRQPYSISQNADDELSEEPRLCDELLRELISLRFTQGFQIVVGPAVAKAFGQKQLKIADIFSRKHIAEDGTSIFMSVGNTIHQLSCVDGTVEVNIFLRKGSSTGLDGDGKTLYRPAIRTFIDHNYVTREVRMKPPKLDRTWNYIDSFLAGHHNELTETLRFWRARFVLIPMGGRHASIAARAPNYEGDSEEEVRIEGIQKLAQIWLKNRYVPPEEKRHQGPANRRRKDPNPLDIVYKTDDPSVVIAAELETLPLIEGLDLSRRGQLVTNRELFSKKNFSVAALAEAMQQPVENGGVRMLNRRWHLRLHYNCFIGSDMTSWLLDNFEDLEDREDAEALGNRLMVTAPDDDKEKQKEGMKDSSGRKDGGGLFVHVEKRHPFRDGQYFYRIAGEYAKPHPPGWFSTGKRKEPSVPATPLSDNMPRESPRVPGLSRPTSITEETASPVIGATTLAAPAATSGKRPKVTLSKVMKYDVDHRKKSYRPEVVDLHYDRLHNPDNCFHIRVDWMNVTAKLIEDAVEKWAQEVAPYGLRLVEVPIAEASAIGENNCFRTPYAIRLAVRPPEKQPATYFDPNSFGPQSQPGRHFYQKALLKKFDFVLDFEAASEFPGNVDVSYSWGRPDYRFTQYIHRSGMIVAQITDEGDFLLLSNRLCNNRAVTVRDKEAQKDGKARPEQGDRDRDRDRGSGPGPLTSRIMGTPGNTYMPYGITELTPFSSPLIKPLIFPAVMSSPAASRAPPPPLSTSSITDYITPMTPAGGAAATAAVGPAAASPLRPTAYTFADPDTVRAELEAFCRDGPGLEAFFQEVLDRVPPPGSSSTKSTPALHAAVVPDSGIPVLGLPPGILQNAGAGAGAGGGGGGGSSSASMSVSSLSASGSIAASATPENNTSLGLSTPRIGSPALAMLRRGSVQDGILGLRIGGVGGERERERERER